MDILERVIRLSRSLSKEQKEDIGEVALECKNLGATGDQLAPLYGTFMVDHDRPISPNVLSEFQKMLLEDQGKEALGRD